MTIQGFLILVMGALFAGAVYMILERSMTRIMLGLVLLTNASNLMIIIMAGDAGIPPIFRSGTDPEEYFDPLPQALTLTSIVISFAVTAFLLAMIYRSWYLVRRDEVQIDVEDVKVAGQPSFDAEDDADLIDESSEFLTDDEDPNVDYDAPLAETAETSEQGDDR